MKHLLLVDDDATIRQQLSSYLEKQGFQITECVSAREALRLDVLRYNLVILDWNLGDGDGIDVLKSWRERGAKTPVIMLTARAELVDRVLGLEFGSHDYVTKPYEPRELLARIRAHLRIAEGASPGEAVRVVNAGIILDLESRRATLQKFSNEPEADVSLTKMEFDLLLTLMRGAGKVFTREELLNRVWGFESNAETRTIDAHVVKLRQKFYEELIETVRGLGYRIRKGERQ